MNYDFSVAIAKTSFFSGEYKQLSVVFEFSTFDDAYQKYKECVADESAHVSTLNSVRSSVTITMARNETIEYRVNIFN
jgi:hypothetical protein